MDRKAKIIATLGPSSSSTRTIEALVDAGIDVARLNFSHGTYETHLELIRIIRALSEKKNRPITILQDLQGPKLRVGDLPKGGVHLVAGEIISMELDVDNHKIDFEDGKRKKIFLEIPDIIHCLKVSSRILLDDGKLELEVLDIYKNGFDAKVLLGGVLTSNKGVNLPGTSLDIPGFTEKDQQDLEFGLENGIDAVAISFVRTAEDVECVKNFVKQKSLDFRNLPVIAKLELPDAVKNLESILDAADGVMVARGDLGVETSPSEVPIIQKEIIQAANRKAKLVITATQMLDSMMENPRPTRAEASDVANAVFDGTDALMLSGETASGKYPLESVFMMDSIIAKAENNIEAWGHYYKSVIGNNQDDDFAISIAARELAQDRQVKAVAVFTQSGRSAFLQSKARPSVPILAFTPNETAYRLMSIYWGVIPHLVPLSDTLKEMIIHVEEALLISGELKAGQKIVLISGFPIGDMRSTNLALLHTIGSIGSD
jgi:pyruvate kinase